jgi:hypothetical protein
LPYITADLPEPSGSLRRKRLALAFLPTRGTL